MFLDFSQVIIGAPEAVFPRLSRELGRLNFSATNLKTGLTARPRGLAGQGENGWRVVRLLWCTHSPALARRMAELLRAWDRKLYLAGEPLEAGPGPWWAYALVR